MRNFIPKNFLRKLLIGFVTVLTISGTTSAFTWRYLTRPKPEPVGATKVTEWLPAFSVDGSEMYVILPGSYIQRSPLTKVDTKVTTPTLEVIATMPQSATAIPAAVPELRARLSHYWPAWGPPNCHNANWNNGICAAALYDGSRFREWQEYVGIGLACPIEFKLGTEFSIPGFGQYICVDRGGSINVLPDGTFFLDLLTTEQPYVKGGEIITDRFSPSGAYVVTVTIVN